MKNLNSLLYLSPNFDSALGIISSFTGVFQPITATMSSQHAHFSAAKCIDGDTEGKSDELDNGSQV